MTYDEACRRLHNNFCSKLSDYTTACKGCPVSSVCYGEYNSEDMTERAQKFESAIIAKVTELNI